MKLSFFSFNLPTYYLINLLKWHFNNKTVQHQRQENTKEISKKIKQKLKQSCCIHLSPWGWGHIHLAFHELSSREVCSSSDICMSCRKIKLRNLVDRNLQMIIKRLIQFSHQPFWDPSQSIKPVYLPQLYVL